MRSAQRCDAVALHTPLRVASRSGPSRENRTYPPRDAGRADSTKNLEARALAREGLCPKSDTDLSYARASDVPSRTIFSGWRPRSSEAVYDFGLEFWFAQPRRLLRAGDPDIARYSAVRRAQAKLHGWGRCWACALLAGTVRCTQKAPAQPTRTSTEPTRTSSSQREPARASASQREPARASASQREPVRRRVLYYLGLGWRSGTLERLLRRVTSLLRDFGSPVPGLRSMLRKCVAWFLVCRWVSG